MKEPFLKFDFRKISLLVSLGIISWLCFLLIGSCSLFLCNITISTSSVWALNILFFSSYSYVLFKKVKLALKQLLYFGFIFIGIVVVCGIGVSYFYDFSYDGQMYHGFAVYHLSHGWNLFKNYLPYQGINIYINHYTQGAWITYTCFYQMIQNFEFAKITNLLLMIGTWGIVLNLLNEFKIKKWLIIVNATLIAFHPVGLNMFLSMYIDGQMASCITLLIAAMILLYLYPKNILYKILFFGVFIYIVNIKFTGLVFACYFWGCFGLLALLTKRFLVQIKNLFIGSIAIVIGFLFIGYSSYVKNMVYFDSIFYPLDVAQNTKGGVLSIEPSTFKNQNRIINFVEATFAKTGYSNYYDKSIEYKFPFMVERKEIERYAFSGVMIGGMGVWFSGILILSIALLIISWIVDKDAKRKMYISILLISILGSCFLLEAPWWARYAPQLYFIPFICLLYYHLVFPFKLKILYVMIILLIANSLFIGLPYTYYNIIVTKKQKKEFVDMQKTGQKYAVDFRQSEAQKVHFEKYNIPYIEVKFDTFSKVPDTLFRSEVVYQLIK